jgi:hypothetical protein
LVNAPLTIVAYLKLPIVPWGALATREIMDVSVRRFFRFARSCRRPNHDRLYRGGALMPGESRTGSVMRPHAPKGMHCPIIVRFRKSVPAEGPEAAQ